MIGGFSKGSGKYECVECGKMTRDTGAGEAEVELCKHCYELAQWENFLENGGSIDKVPAKYRKELGG